MGFFACRVICFASFVTAAGFCQLPSSQCDQSGTPIAECAFLTETSSTISQQEELPEHADSQTTLAREGGDPAPNPFLSNGAGEWNEHFHWGRALFESFTFLSIEQAYVVKDDYHWVTVENGIPFNHYWRDYTDSLRTWAHSGWNDGDPLMYGYVGHPIQGALTEYIQIQNDPQGRDLEFSNTKAYWWSRFKAFWWNAAYSTQWNIGPLSEMTVEKYGTIDYARRAWNHDGSTPCYSHCVTGVGQIDLVTTPVGGTLWLLTEDILDKKVNRPIESATSNRFLIDFTRCALNPIRGGANILHGKPPWYRSSRDRASSPH